jgi:hypothetical protein
MKILSQDSRSPGRGLNPGPPEYDAGMLYTTLLRSVIIILDLFLSLNIPSLNSDMT